MANPTRNNNNNGTATATGNGGRSAVPENYAVANSERALMHRITLQANWTRDEQLLFEQLLNKYASEKPVVRFANIAGQLNDKTVRDVALRFRWMNKKEDGKRRKDNSNSSRRHKNKKGKIAVQQSKPSSISPNRDSGIPYTQSPTSMDSDDGISYAAIGGTSGQLLEQNAQALKQIFRNFSALKVYENIHLIAQTRNNIVALLNDSANDMLEQKQMPPLNVKLNDELAHSLVHQPYMHMKF